MKILIFINFFIRNTVDLQKRIEYLSLAVANAKSHVPTSGHADNELENYLEERLEVKIFL